MNIKCIYLILDNINKKKAWYYFNIFHRFKNSNKAHDSFAYSLREDFKNRFG